MSAAHSAGRVLGVVGVVILLALLVHKIADPRGYQKSGRAVREQCARHLRAIGEACLAYASAPLGPGGAKGYLPHAASSDEDDRPEHVGEAFALLIRAGFIDDPEVLTCYASNDIPVRPGPDWEPLGFRFEDNDVRTSHSFSYGFVRAQARVGETAPETVIAAERSAWSDADPVPHDGLIRNHFEGRHILRLDGSVEWVSSDEASKPAMAAALAGLNLAD